MTNFELPKRKSGKATIVAVFWKEGKRHRLSTGIKIHESDWDARKQRSKSNPETNKLLAEFSESRPRKLETSHASRLAVQPNGNIHRAPHAMLSAMLKTFGNGNRKHNTMKGHRTAANQIAQLFPHEPWPPAPKFLSRYADALRAAGFTEGTIKTRISKTSTMLDELGAPPEKKPKIIVPDSGFGYADAAKIARLKTMTLEADYLDNARHCFLILYATGQRYSDLAQIIASQINSDRIIKIQQTKTEIVCYIPISAETESRMKAARVISNQKLNKYLKEIGTMLEIEKMSCHMARRSFATNALIAGISIPDTMRIGGWRSLSMFMKYVRITEIQAAQNMKGHVFFFLVFRVF